MDVVLIGAGNVAHVLGRSLKAAGHVIIGIWNRDASKAEMLAKELGAECLNNLSAIPENADLYVLAVSDHAIADLAKQLNLKNGILIHNGGTVAIEVLAGAAPKYGVLWPMKMMRTSMKTLDDCTMVLDGSDEETKEKLKELAYSLSERVTMADNLTRRKMHLVAAIVSNFTNHLYHLASDYCTTNAIDFSIFYPIIESVAKQIQTEYPGNIQAGPAFRGDADTIEKHRQLLAQNQSLLKLYDAITASIRDKFPR